MLRTVLVSLDGSTYSETAATLALEWGTRFGAHLVGLGILDKPSITGPEPVPIGGAAFKKERDEARLADAHKQIQVSLYRFQERCMAAGVPSQIFEDVGEPTECILKQAHRCDVVILGRETHFHFETQDQPDSTLAQVLRASPRPVVVVPQELPDGNGVIVAYGGGREVARTLQTFQLLGLAGGEIVHLVSISHADGKAETVVDLAAEFLESHGAFYQLLDLNDGRATADILLEQVRILRPRLLVMGAHGHHPIRDLFATSVTRAVLRACPVPVLIGA